MAQKICRTLRKLQAKYEAEFKRVVQLLREGEIEEARARALLLADLKRSISLLGKFCSTGIQTQAQQFSTPEF